MKMWYLNVLHTRRTKVVKKRKKSKTSDNIVNPVPQYSQNVEQEKIQSLVSELKGAQKADYLCRLLKANECKPYGYEEMHSNLSSKKKNALKQRPMQTIELL